MSNLAKELDRAAELWDAMSKAGTCPTFSRGDTRHWRDLYLKAAAALATDPRAMVAAAYKSVSEMHERAYERSANSGDLEKAAWHQQCSEQILSFIDTEPVELLEALVQERAGALVAAAYAEASKAAYSLSGDRVGDWKDGYHQGAVDASREIESLTTDDARAELDSLISEAEARGYQRGQKDEREACAKLIDTILALSLSEDARARIAAAIRARGGDSDG